MQAGRSVRESAPGRSGRGPPPFDASAFAAVASKRKLEIVNKQCLVSLRQLMQHKWAFPFVKPVDAEALGLPTYHQVVKTPMDLGTVEANIKKGGVYGSCEEVHRDVALTFANAKLFNPPATDVHVMATTLEQFWAPRWDAIQERVREVEESMNVEKEAAEKRSAEMSARQALAAEEMKCAGLMADLDQLKRGLEDLKRTAVRAAKPMTERERGRLSKRMAKLPKGFRRAARDIIAETEGAHVVPEGAFGDDGWQEICGDLHEFGHVAHRRLARFAKVRRRNQEAVRAGLCAVPTTTTLVDATEGASGEEEEAAAAGGAAGCYGFGKDFEFGDETESEDEEEQEQEEAALCRPVEEECVPGTLRVNIQQSAGVARQPGGAAMVGGDGPTLQATPGALYNNNNSATTSQQQQRHHVQYQQHLDSVEATLAAAAAAAAAAVTAAENGKAARIGGDGDEEEDDPLLALANGGGDWGATMGAAASAQPELAEVIARESGGYFVDRSVSRDSPPGGGAAMEVDMAGSVLNGPEAARVAMDSSRGHPGKGGRMHVVFHNGNGNGGHQGNGNGNGAVAGSIPEGGGGDDLAEDLLLNAPVGDTGVVLM